MTVEEPRARSIRRVADLTASLDGARSEHSWVDSIVWDREADAPRFPTTLYRVDFLQGYGMPHVTRRERRKRNFERPQDVADFLASLARWPKHHRLIAVNRTDLGLWVPVPVEELPEPRERIEDDDD